MATQVSANGLDQALLDFARDISKDDQAVLAQIEQIIAKPPTELEEIGFYGAEDASIDERKFRATISYLNTEGHIIGFEDKYIHDMIYLLQDMGWMNPDSPVSAYVEGLEERIADYDNDTAESDAAAHLAKTFARHTKELDAAIAETGKALIFIDLPRGDTLHLVQVSNALAAKWRDVAFVRTCEHIFAVTDPQWSVYYDFLANSALSLPNIAPSPVTLRDPATFRDLADLGYSL